MGEASEGKSVHRVAVVSAFDRGVWAAIELRSKGMEVDFFDVTSAMGNWPPEDVEGPFGFFHQGKIPSSYIHHLNVLSPLRPVENGLTIWTRSLPFQLKSPLIREQLTQRNIFPPETQGSSSRVFEQNWLRYFSSQWGSLNFYENYELAPEGTVTPYQKEFMIRSPSRADREKVKGFLQSQGVRVLSKTDIVDLSFGGRSLVSGFELQGEEKGIRKFDDVLWCLTSEETRHLSKKLFKHLYDEVVEPQWAWIRFRVEFADCEELGVLPEHLSFIRDLYSPWTHSNWLIAQRTALKRQFDFWMRIPGFQRFNKNYLLKKGDRLKDFLVERMTESNPEILSYPQENYYSYDQMGPSRWVQYDLNSNRRSCQSSLTNVHFSTPETWLSSQWLHRYESEESLVKKIFDRWQKILSKERKNEAEL